MAREVGNSLQVCLRLGPDAVSDVSQDVQISIVGRGGAGDGDGDNEIEMIGRTPATVLMRDTLFHLCTLRQSGMITSAQYERMMQDTISRGFDLAHEEIENTTLSITSQSAAVQNPTETTHSASLSNLTSTAATSESTSPATTTGNSGTDDAISF